jgi:5'-3' exonuclease
MRLYAWDMGSMCAWAYFGGDTEAADGMLHKLREYLYDFMERMQPTHMVMCFDSGNNFRQTIDPEYKAARRTKPKPENYVVQLRQAPDVVRELGLAVARVDTFEADDMLATVTTDFAGPDCQVVVCSRDKDCMALVGEHVQQFDPTDGRFYDEAAVLDKLGVPPHRVADFLAIAGDSSDGIRGIPGVGKVTALTALQQTRSMTELWRKATAGQLAGLKAATQQKLADGRAAYDEARKLVGLRYDVPHGLSLEDCRVKPAQEVAA